MRILFYAINSSLNPSFERELDLMSQHIEKGDDIYVVGCDGILESCYSNPNHIKPRCVYCKLRFSEGLKHLNISRENIFHIGGTLLYQDLPEKFDNIEALKSFILFNIDFGLGVASELISLLRDHRPDTILHQKIINKMLVSSVLIYEYMSNLLAKLNPELIYIFNGRYFDVRPVVRLAEKLNITFYTHEAAGRIDKYSLFKNSFPHDIAPVLESVEKSWLDSDKNKIEIGSKWFVDHRNGQAFNGLSYINKNFRTLLPNNFDNTKINIAIFNTSFDEFEAICGWENPIYNSELEALIKLVDSFKNNDKIDFYLRVHPNLKNLDNTQIKDLKYLDRKAYKNLKIIWPEDAVDSYTLLDNCDKVLTFLSTMGVEACFWGKPSILLGHAYYESLDCVYIPKNHEEVVAMIYKKLEPKSTLGAIKYGYWLETQGFFYKKYVPTAVYEGKFDGKVILPKYSLKKIKFWSYRLLEKLEKGF